MNTADIKVGDTVHVDLSRYGRIDVREGKVSNVSGTGVIRVDFSKATYSFMKDGWERGKTNLHRGRLIDESTYLRLKEDAGNQSLCRKVRYYIDTLAATPVTAHNKAELITQLEAALSAVRRMPE